MRRCANMECQLNTHNDMDTNASKLNDNDTTYGNDI